MTQYRYVWPSDWLHDSRRDGKTLCFMMLNPSCADDSKDDPTMRKCKRIAKALYYKHLCIVNLYAARSSKPDKLRNMIDPVGKDNDEVIRKVLRRLNNSDLIICAWGASLFAKQERINKVKTILRDCDASVSALKINKNGSPRHPLYVPKDTKPLRYNIFDN